MALKKKKKKTKKKKTKESASFEELHLEKGSILLNSTVMLIRPNFYWASYCYTHYLRNLDTDQNLAYRTLDKQKPKR